MKILARIPTRNGPVDVEVLDIFDGACRKMAVVRALVGEPFQSWSHGGWSCSAVASIPVSMLQPVIVDQPVLVTQEVENG